MTAFKYCSIGEAKMAKAIVRAIFADGFTIRHNDGEEDTGLYSANDEKALFGAMCQTDCDYLSVINSNGAKLGVIFLVYGNAEDGSELISDYSDNDYIAGIVAKVEG